MMKHLYFYLAFLFLISTNSNAQRQAGGKYISPTFGPNFSIGYVKYFPKNYNTSTQKFPLLISLHGSGNQNWNISPSNPDDTSQLDKVRKVGVAKLIESDPNFNLPFVVISPQSPFGDWDNVITGSNGKVHFEPGALINEIVEKMKTLYRIDPNRVYITGYSAGGDGVWNYVLNYPDKVAAAIPMCPTWTDKTKACVIAENKIGIWAFHVTADGYVDDSSIDMVNAINNCNPETDAKLTLYKGKGHLIWDMTYDNSGVGIAPDNIYTWLAGFSKSSTSHGSNTFSGFYTITNRNSEKVLDVDSASLSNGAPVIQWDNNGNQNQEWEIVDMGDGSFKFVARHSKKVIDLKNSNLADGNEIQQWKDNGTDAQRWQIVPLENNFYKIISKASGKALQVNGSSLENGAIINQWTYSNNFSKQWMITKLNIITSTDAFADKDAKEKSSKVLQFKKDCDCIEVPTKESGVVEVCLYDATGKIYLQERKTINKGSSNLIITSNLDLTNGIYFLNINGDSETKNFKCIKE